MNPEVEVYVKELSKLRYGYPLYDPDPAESYDRVRIGDVGYVTDYGCFLRLFNVFYPEGHPINNLGVPDGFMPFDERYQRSHRSQAIQPGVICSSHVRRLDAGASFSGGVFPVGFTIRLSCADHQGAALVIKRRAVREDTRCRKAFRDLMLRRHQAWYAFARDELQTDTTMDDILLVTGHIMTNEWATATVVEKTRNCEMRFNYGSGLGTLGDASASVWGSWTSSVSLPLRFGPTSLPPPRADSNSTSVHISTTNTSSPTDQPLVPQTANVEDDIDPPPNQCIFVRGYRLILRPPFFLRKIKAAAEPKDEDGRSRDQNKHSVLVVAASLDSREEIGKDNLTPKQCDIYEGARDYIFMNSDVDVVLLSDDDVRMQINPTTSLST
ncbi:hypothetical protein SCHPADRAFT_103211 [Schizopora paradoxa]|uniref:Uncharacterized protein n=1 Tax=Schizopora paradoxa TaxID=27342 RepID=A0A0H2S4G5_9AGAM|nr:hypothetical protein SCHPADRAFT_103211 [Schizopora paradoxa]